MNRIDPDGRDIIVLNSPSGANFSGRNYGHMAMLVGNDVSGWTYISKDGRVDGETTLSNNVITGGPSEPKIISAEKDENLKTLDAFDKSELGQGYTERVRFATDKKQDDAAIEVSKTSVKSKYHGIFSNCADAVSDGLKAAGLDPGYSRLLMPMGARIEFLFPSPNARFKVMSPLRKVPLDIPQHILT